ncbi:CbiQ family ECF transporter T component [Clostridium paraputrificum]
MEKIGLVLVSLISCSYTENIYIILGNIVFFIILNIKAKNPFNMIKKFICITGAFFIFTAVTLLWQGNSVEYIVLLLLRILNGSLTIAFLSLTTPINHLVYLMSKFEYLRDVGDIIKVMERFISVIEDDFVTTFKAMKSRAGFCGFKNSIIDFGKVCGITFKNLIFRWREINLSLKNRCYVGKHNYNYSFKLSKVRVTFVIFYLFTVILMNYIMI